MGVLRALPFLFLLMLACATADVSRSDTRPVSEAPKPAAQESAEPVEAETAVPKEISLRQAAALALVQSPDLAAYTWEVRAAEARILQAGTRPVPELSLEIEDLRWNESASTRVESFSIATDGLSYEREREGGLKPGLGTAETTISLSQVIELGGKRMRRVRLAETERDLVQWDYEAARIEVLTGVTRAFVELLGAQDRLRLQEELTAFSERVREVSAARVEAGQVSPLELTRAETELASMRIARDAAARVVEAARVRLAGEMGLREASFDRAVGSMEDVATPPAFETLVAAVEKNPDLARWADEMDQRLAALELERAQRVPDVTIAAGFRTVGLDTADGEAWSVGTDFNALNAGLRHSDTDLSRERENSIVLGATVPLPLGNRNRGAIREAEYRVEKARAEQEAAEVRVRSGLRAAYEDLQRSAETALRIRNEILPGARSTFELTQEGYQQGKFGFLEVLDTQRTLFEVQRQYTDALIDYHAALTDVERLIGQPLSTLGGEPAEVAAESGENDEHP